MPAPSPSSALPIYIGCCNIMTRKNKLGQLLIPSVDSFFLSFSLSPQSAPLS